MNPRFSKKALAEYIQTRIQTIQKTWGFDPSTGTKQIPYIAADRLGRDPIDRSEILTCADGDAVQYTLGQCHQAYAELCELAALANYFELDGVSEWPPAAARGVTIQGGLTRYISEDDT